MCESLDKLILLRAIAIFHCVLLLGLYEVTTPHGLASLKTGFRSARRVEVCMQLQTKFYCMRTFQLLSQKVALLLKHVVVPTVVPKPDFLFSVKGRSMSHQMVQQKQAGKAKHPYKLFCVF